MGRNRDITYELKLGNLAHLLYTLSNGRPVEGVSMRRVLEVPLKNCHPKEIHGMNEEFLDLHFGNLFYNLGNIGHPKDDPKRDQLYSDLWGRPQNTVAYNGSGTGYRAAVVETLLARETTSDGKNAGIEELVIVNKNILSKWNRKSFYTRMKAYVQKIEAAEALEKKFPWDLDELGLLLEMVYEALNLRTLEGDAIALTWLLLGALLRHKTIEVIRNVESDRYLEYFERKKPDDQADSPEETKTVSPAVLKPVEEECGSVSEFEQLINNLDTSGQTGYKGFYFKNMEFDCFGREKEKEILDRFLEQGQNPVSWLSVTGKSGVGKSKLLYHYIMSNKDPNWKMVMLEAKSIQQIIQCGDWKYSKKLLIVFDYAEESAKEIGSWIFSLNADNTQNRIRVILIARDGILKENGEFANASWYVDLLGEHEQNQFIQDIQFQFESDYKSIHIEGVTDDVGIKIISDYILKHDRDNLEKYDLKEIYDAAANIDSAVEFPRPAVILFTVDAYIKHEDPRKWELEQLTQYITNDILDYLKKDLFKHDEANVYDEMVKLLLYATCTGKLNIEAEADISPYFARARELFLGFPGTRKEQILQSMNSCIQSPYFLYPLEPDLVGEKFVMDSFLKLHNKERVGTTACDLLNRYPESFSRYLIRCISDYHHVPRYRALFDGAMRNWKIIYAHISNDAMVAWLQVLLSLAYYTNSNNKELLTELYTEINILTELLEEPLVDILMRIHRA